MIHAGLPGKKSSASRCVQVFDENQEITENEVRVQRKNDVDVQQEIRRRSGSSPFRPWRRRDYQGRKRAKKAAWIDIHNT